MTEVDFFKSHKCVKKLWKIIILADLVYAIILIISEGK